MKYLNNFKNAFLTSKANQILIYTVLINIAQNLMFQDDPSYPTSVSLHIWIGYSSVGFGCLFSFITEMYFPIIRK